MMKSIEKLREYTQDMRKRSVTPGHNPCADEVDGYLDEIEAEIAELQASWAQEAREHADDSARLAELARENAELKREIAERYMELPLDADGVPIHVGDEMEWTDSHNGERERFVCAGYTTEHSTWTPNNITLMATNDECAEFYCDQCHHVKRQDLEDVLLDLVMKTTDINAHALDDDIPDRLDALIGEYADKVREAVEK